MTLSPSATLVSGFLAGLALSYFSLLSSPSPSHVWVCFSPREPCLDHLADLIRSARHSIMVRAFILSSPPLAEALLTAHVTGVNVRLLTDEQQSQSPWSLVTWLATRGITVRIDRTPEFGGLAHNKVIIVDERAVATGSPNFSRAASSRNAENLVVLKDEEACRRFVEDWMIAWERHSVPFEI